MFLLIFDFYCMWHIINSGPQDAVYLMEKDRDLLNSVEKPTLHLYRFKNPSLTYGCLMKPSEHLDISAMNELGIQMAVRPTGGGALFHLWDLAFSLIIPLSCIPHVTHTLDRYKIINDEVKEAISPLIAKKELINFLQNEPASDVGERFCMAKPTQFDVMMESKKLVGSAQRVTKHALLHQATVAICKPDLELLQKVLLDARLPEKMLEQSFVLSDFSYKDKEKLDLIQTQIEKLLVEQFNKSFEEFFKN